MGLLIMTLILENGIRTLIHSPYLFLYYAHDECEDTIAIAPNALVFTCVSFEIPGQGRPNCCAQPMPFAK